MKCGFVVEGHLESDVISHICKGAELRRLRLNGRDVSVQKIADIIYPHIIFLLRKVDLVYVIVDREQRSLSSEEMERELLNCLLAKGLNEGRIVISVPDRNIESWFVPFLDENCVLQGQVCNANLEGRNAKSEVKRIFRRNGKNYVEVIDGVRYLKLIVPSEAAKVSRSFERFYNFIHEDCWWKRKMQTS